jgi:hypothetical protein
MANVARSRVRVDRDGVRTTYDPRARWLVAIGAVASCLVGAFAILAVLLSPQPAALLPPQPAVEEAIQDGAAPGSDLAAEPEEKHERRQVRAVHVVPGAAPGAASAEAKTGEKEPELLARDVIPALVAAGETEGIAAFPPPGTDPIKRGIVVPDDFELPEGYARHYQTTDDGEQLAPVLMFAPNYEFVDDDGKALPLPGDGIVPPEMAPAGLPIRMLRVPRHKRPDRAP